MVDNDLYHHALKRQDSRIRGVEDSREMQSLEPSNAGPLEPLLKLGRWYRLYISCLVLYLYLFDPAVAHDCEYLCG